jgi:hypothetical protein
MEARIRVRNTYDAVDKNTGEVIATYDRFKDNYKWNKDRIDGELRDLGYRVVSRRWTEFAGVSESILEVEEI